MTDLPSPAPSSPKPVKSVHQTPPFSGLRTVLALILREMGATYGRSPGGYIWAILEPALGLSLMVAIFSLGFRTPPLGTDFAIFYASGLLPYGMFTSTSGKVAQSINFSRQLMGYPRVTFMDAILARLLLNVLTQGMVACILFTAIRSVSDTRTILDLKYILHAYAMAIGLGLGIGMLNCMLFARYPLWSTAWSVITRPLVLVSGVIFLHDNIPEPYRHWLSWNPLVHMVGEARRGFYYSYSGDYVDPVYAWSIAGITIVLGLVFLHSYHRNLMER